jgi:hypothetical protein
MAFNQLSLLASLLTDRIACTAMYSQLDNISAQLATYTVGKLVQWS